MGGPRIATLHRSNAHATISGSSSLQNAFGGQPDSETRSNPVAHVVDEELLVCREPLRLKAW
jgi:hypothetical protein